MFTFVLYRQYVLQIALCVLQYVSYRVFSVSTQPWSLPEKKVKGDSGAPLQRTTRWCCKPNIKALGLVDFLQDFLRLTYITLYKSNKPSDREKIIKLTVNTVMFSGEIYYYWPLNSSKKVDKIVVKHRFSLHNLLR